MKFLPFLSYVYNVLYVVSLPWEGVYPNVILVVYFVVLCKQIATDNKYFILIRLLLNNMGKCHYFSRLNLRRVSCFTVSQSFPGKVGSYF